MFFRHRTDSEKRAAVRSRGSNEAQLKELRIKARRRLIGALALVLAAVIVVPWFFQEPVTDNTHPPVVVPVAPHGTRARHGTPSSGTPAPANGSGAAVQPGTTQGTVQSSSEPAPSTSSAAQAPAAPAEPAATRPAAVAGMPEPPQTSSPKPVAESAATERKPTETKPAEAAKPPKKTVERTDDGSLARALLSGKAPVQSGGSSTKTAPGQGRYFLQVAAYTTEQDANVRRDSLRQAGVTDAYVERGTSAGRTVYRLRVGPFGSHEAAQAAQARLRALGYQNGLISAN